jgi:hypothetical protein
MGALFLPTPDNFARHWYGRCAGSTRTVDALDEVLNWIVLIRTKDSLVFRMVQGNLVSNDASADATICRAVP